MKYANNFKQQAIDLQSQGKSIREISRILSISPSTISIWLRDCGPMPTKICKKCNKDFINITNGYRQLCYSCKPATTDIIIDLENNTKKCSMCNSWVSFENFTKLSGRYHSHCKLCISKYKTNTLPKIKDLCVEYKGGKCEQCNNIYPNCCYDFHHIDPSKKEFTISRAKCYKFNQKIKNELDKCMLLCANCHRIIHDKSTPSQT